MNYILLAFANDFVGSLGRRQSLWHLLDQGLFAGLTLPAPLVALAATLKQRRLIA